MPATMYDDHQPGPVTRAKAVHQAVAYNDVRGRVCRTPGSTHRVGTTTYYTVHLKAFRALYPTGETGTVIVGRGTRTARAAIRPAADPTIDPVFAAVGRPLDRPIAYLTPTGVVAISSPRSKSTFHPSDWALPS